METRFEALDDTELERVCGGDDDGSYAQAEWDAYAAVGMRPDDPCSYVDCSPSLEFASYQPYEANFPG
jgi:hypothetical protein